MTAPHPDWVEQARRFAAGLAAEHAGTGLTDVLDGLLGAPAGRRPETGEGPHPDHSAECRWCPLCAGLAALRGRRPDLLEALADVLDGAAVGLVPDVASRALGQSSMKTYDYCARGVPVVATAGHLEHSSDVPPHTYVVTGAAEMAAAMVAAADEPVSRAEERVDWAADRTWSRRTDAWLDAMTGTRPAG